MSISKSKSPEYSQVCGYIKKPIALKFRVLCKAKEAELSQVMEDLMINWIEENEQVDQG
ncbi:hypothetical protein [Anabaena sp. CCY 0017]|uniref:hypothetical protein n=1 Tax=Anabaena sp. CCY 0017 TaxID=3103866 RepID=UPI0039C5BDD2